MGLMQHQFVFHTLNTFTAAMKNIFNVGWHSDPIHSASLHGEVFIVPGTGVL